MAIWSLGLALGVALAVIAAFVFLLTQERGLQWSLQLLQRVTPGELHWVSASGALRGPLLIEGLEYLHDGSVYRVARVALDWDPARLLTKRLVVHSLALNGVDILLADADRPPDDRPFDPAAALPVDVTLDDVRVAGARIRRSDGDLAMIARIALSATSARGRMEVRSFALQAERGDVEARGVIGLAVDANTDLLLSGRIAPADAAAIAGEASVRGTHARLQVVAQLDPPHSTRLQLDIQEPFTELRWRGDATTALALQALDPTWPEWRVAATWQGEGTRTRYTVAVGAHIDAADLPSARLNARVDGDSERLRVEQLSLATLGGAITGTMDVDWSAQLRWEGRLQAEGIDPGQQWQDWPGRLNASVHARGEVDDTGALVDVRVERLTGELRGYPVDGRGHLVHDASGLHLTDVNVRSGSAQFTADGVLGTTWDVRWQLDAPAVEHLLAGYGGALTASGALGGTRAQPHLRLQGQARNLTGPELALGTARLDADIGLHPSAAVKLIVRAADLRFAQRRFDDLNADLDGRTERHALTLRLRGAEHDLQVHARGGWDGAQWSGRLERADWRLPEVGAWRLAEPVAIRLGQSKGALDTTCWRQATARLCAGSSYDADERRLDVELNNAALTQWRALPGGARIEGGALDVVLRARLPAGAPVHAQVDVQVAPGAISWLQGEQRQRAAFGGADARLRMDAAGMRAEAQLRLGGDDGIRLQVAAPPVAADTSVGDLPLTGSMRGEVRDLALVNGMVESVDELSGVLRLDLAVDGALGAPRVRGELQWAEGRVSIGPAGVELEDVRLTVRDSGDAADGALEIRGSARSGPGRVEIDGRVETDGQVHGDRSNGTRTRDGLSADLRVTGTDFEALDLAEARVLVSPDLRFAVRGRTVTIDGAVHIPDARITPRDVSGAVSPSRDVVRVDLHAPESAADWIVQARVHVSLGSRVSFKGFGVQGRLAGALDIVDDAGRQPRAHGELAIHDGTYSAYGQELKIERGRALYRDSPLDNPGLDVRATRRSGNVLAGVRVLGTARDPVAELYSQPPLPDADVLSYLVLGRPLAGASGSEGELLFQAATALGLKGGARLAQTIGARFGLDEVAVSSGGDAESAALTLGKYLSPRLYLSYSIGLLDAVDRLRLRYQLTERLSVQTETGAGAGGDLLYTIER